MTPPRPAALLRTAVAAALALGVATAAHAQYKVVGPDGRVTYTDRAPSSEQGRVVPLGAEASRTSVIRTESTLPLELRDVAQRYPVTLYTLPTACEPCDAGRTLLRQRGIPYAERQVLGTEDGEALERITGSREAPALTIGSQTLRGYSPAAWAQYLDLAGYPKTSRLPANWTARTGPVVERQAVAAAPAATPATPAAAPVAPVTPPGAAGIRF